MIEVLPGVYRFETDMAENRLCMHLLCGERTLLIDCGVRTTPEADIYPALESADMRRDIDLLLISHADADHHGGAAAIRSGSPNVMILSHESDRPRIESKACHLGARYDEVVEDDDVHYPPEVMDWLSDMIGTDTLVDVGLCGGETLGLGDGVRLEVLHTPGHTAGHLSVWNPEQRLLIMQDAVLGRGVPNRSGEILSPPPYYDVAAYVETVKGLRALNPEWLLTAHYRIMRGPEISDFFATSLAFVEQLDRTVIDAVQEACRPLTLSAVIDVVDERLGPFATRIQWIGPTLAHLHAHVRTGQLKVRKDGSDRAWEPA